MSIHPLNIMDESEAKKVWSTCFGDTDVFIDQYFKSFVQYQKTMGYYEDGKLLADLFMLPFCGKLQGRQYEADFLAGCATLPEARKRGLMRELVRVAMLDMRKRGQAVTYLHPFLHAFYRQFGYETIAYIQREEIVNTSVGNSAAKVHTVLDDVPVSRMFLAYQKYISGFDNAFVRTEKRFYDWIGLLFAEDGQCVCIQEANDCRYALYYLNGDTAEVFELVCDDAIQRENLLMAIPAGKIEYFLPANNNTGSEEEFTMMRVLDPVVVLENLSVKKTKFTIAILDSFLKEEYLLEVTANGHGKNIVIPGRGLPDISLSIAAFANAAAGAFHPESACAGFFERQTAVFFETY